MIPNRKRIAVLYAATVLGSLLWLAAIIAAPYWRARAPGISSFLYGCFAPLCHQRPERSFRMAGFPLSVCARCLGIYAGFFLGLLAYPFVRGFGTLRLPKMTTFALVSWPIAVDTAANVLRLWNTGNGPRFVLGLLWGAILPFFFMTGTGELVSSRRP
jgi:uncharacterized membrane protein